MSISTDETAKRLFVSLDEAFRDTPGGVSDWYRLGVDDEAIAQVEARLDISMPSEYRAIFKLFNGFWQRAALRHNGEWFTGFDLFPLEDWGNEEVSCWIRECLCSESGVVNELYDDAEYSVIGPAKKVLWHPRWVALTFPDSNYSWYADFAPEAGGVPGQVVFVDAVIDGQVKIEVVAPDFFKFIEIIIDSA